VARKAAVARTSGFPSEASVSAFLRLPAVSGKIPDSPLLGEVIKESAPQLSYDDMDDDGAAREDEAAI
jgi:hypothetical protein